MKLELYQLKGCPYCVKVRDFISAHDLETEVRYFYIDRDEAANDRLIAATDDDQVPCLMIDGKPMLESDDIIAFMQKYLVDRRQKAV